jgi:carboxymethylenebutenolidase
VIHVSSLFFVLAARQSRPAGTWKGCGRRFRRAVLTDLDIWISYRINALKTIRPESSQIVVTFYYTWIQRNAGSNGKSGPIEQENRMYNGKSQGTGLISTMAILAFMLGGCEAEQAANDSAEKEAARANVDAMSREHAEDTTEPSPAAKIAPARPVVSQTMAYTEHNDELVYGYFSAPADMFEPLPAVIMIHEWWGLNDNIRSMADRLAGEGYIVFAVDLYAGGVASTPEEARALMIEAVEDPESGNDNIRAAYEFVSKTAGAPRIGSLGWCFGGGWSLNTARLFPHELDASVIYYGQVSDDEDLLRPIEAPILGLFAAEDTGIKVASVEAFRDALRRLRKNYEIHIYPGVGHAFANPSGSNYDAVTAEDAWRRTLEFLDRHLSVSESTDAPST